MREVHPKPRRVKNESVYPISWLRTPRLFLPKSIFGLWKGKQSGAEKEKKGNFMSRSSQHDEGTKRTESRPTRRRSSVVPFPFLQRRPIEQPTINITVITTIIIINIGGGSICNSSAARIICTNPQSVRSLRSAICPQERGREARLSRAAGAGWQKQRPNSIQHFWLEFRLEKNRINIPFIF